MVEEVDGVDTLAGPGSLSVEESVETDEVNLTSPANVDGVFVTTGTWLGGAALLFVEVDSDAGVVTVKTLAGPCEFVGVPDPEIVWLAESGLDATGVPNLLQ